jgi:hypothetical protein
VPQPRTEADAVAELHALLGAAGVPGPYVLGAHSLGGLMARLYAAAYPGEVVGLVLVDAYNEQIEALMTPEQWAALVRFNVDSGSDTVLPIPDYGPVETIPYGGGNPRIRRAVAATPLPALPLAVLAHVRPFELPTSVGGLSPEAMEGILGAANAWQATLAPRARYFAAHASGHDVHQDQPALVAEAIRQVVAGVRDPDTWSDLTVCCDPTAGSVAAEAAPLAIRPAGVAGRDRGVRHHLEAAVGGGPLLADLSDGSVGEHLGQERLQQGAGFRVLGDDGAERAAAAHDGRHARSRRVGLGRGGAA